MSFNYPELFNQLSLQLKELDDIMRETRQAVSTLGHNRNLLERHQQTAVRLEEVTTHLKALDHRMVELAETRQFLDPNAPKPYPTAGAPTVKTTFAQARRNGFTQRLPKDRNGTDGDEPRPTISQSQQNLNQLELMNIQSQQAAQEVERQQLEQELKSLEDQLAAHGLWGRLG